MSGMEQPAIDIGVEPETGRWYVDALPMVLVPQHFFLNNHVAVEAALGPERLAEVLRPAGSLSARHWCGKEAAFHGLSGPDVFRHYMRRLSQRGWAQFSVLSLDPEAGTAEIRVDHSIFVTGRRPGATGKLCYMFASWLEGALDYVTESAGHPRPVEAREAYCASEEGRDHCLFTVTPKA